MDNIKVIYQDDDILVLDKPPGLVVDPAETVKEPTLVDYLKDSPLANDTLERMGIVHRLDKDTSGIILVSKTQKTLDNLQSQFKERLIKKEYIALVHGFVEKGGVVEGNIGRNPGNRKKFTVLEEGKEAVTEYEPLQSLVMSSEFIEKIFSGFNKIQMRKLRIMNYQLYTLVACRPQTGRTHQIRVHLKYINHPIVADEKYVGRKMYRLDKRWCGRLFLHASRIGFNHPTSREWMEFESELPEDLRKVLTSFEQ